MLTDADCKNASCPPDKKRARLSDAGNLYLEVPPNGAKRWFWKHWLNAKEKRLAPPPLVWGMRSPYFFIREPLSIKIIWINLVCSKLNVDAIKSNSAQPTQTASTQSTSPSLPSAVRYYNSPIGTTARSICNDYEFCTQAVDRGDRVDG